MTGNVALDIFIGLVFVYLLYSLFAAVILEIISTWLKLRSKNLYRAISTMLNDARESKKKSRIGKGLLWFVESVVGGNPSQEKNGLAEEFYKSNGIAYLGGSIWKNSKPSNITADQFIKGLFEIMLKDQKANTSQSITIEAFLNETEKTDSYRENSDSGISYLKFLFNQSFGDVEKFKELVKEWYEEMMKVSKEWYKQRIQIWLFIIGITLAAAFNINTLYITKILSLNNGARDQMVQMASAALENLSPEEINKLKGDTKALINYQKEIQKQAKEASDVLSLPSRSPKKIKVKAVLSGDQFIAYQTKMDTTAGPVISYKYFTDGDRYIVFEQPSELPYLNVGNFVSGYDQANGSQKKGLGYRILDIVYDKNEYDDYTSGKYVYFDRGKYFWRYQIWGFLITALAISLGAPFWYDLLNKLMRLRSVAQSVSPSTEGKNQPKSETPPRVG